MNERVTIRCVANSEQSRKIDTLLRRLKVGSGTFVEGAALHAAREFRDNGVSLDEKLSRKTWFNQAEIEISVPDQMSSQEVVDRFQQAFSRQLDDQLKSVKNR